MVGTRRRFLATAGAGVVASLGGCADALGFGGLSDDDFDVGMSANAFLPEEHVVSVGDTVVWGNNGSRGHTVTAYDAAIPDGAAFFASGGYADTERAREDWHERGGGNIPPGDVYAHTFEVPGEHPYFCIPHEPAGMVGIVVVEE